MLSAISGNVNTVFALILAESELRLHSIEDTFLRMVRVNWFTPILRGSPAPHAVLTESTV